MSKRGPNGSPSLPTLADVQAAHDRIRGRVVRTPVLRSAALDEIAGAELWLKAENLQKVGAFKARGALHAVGRLTDEERQRGIITFSSGNHAQAVALAAKVFGCRADIAMPVDAPKIKLDAVEALGANVVQWGTTSTERHKAALEIQKATGGIIIHPFDHPHIVAGAGTATLELAEQVAQETDGGELDAVLVPVGGGGLISGACIATSESKTRVFSVEPRGCDALRASLEAGERVAVEPEPTLADGLKPTRVGELNFRIAQEHVRGSFLVDDLELGQTLVRLLLALKVLVEPSGAAALAVALRRDLLSHLDAKKPRIGVILSGGNATPGKVSELLAHYG